MSEEIIIDGVNVAGCEFYDNSYCRECDMRVHFYNDIDCNDKCNKDCYFKQFQRLKKMYNDLINKVNLETVSQLEKENKELAKILDSKNGTISTLVSERDKFKEEKNKYYQQTLDDEIVINELAQENEELKNREWDTCYYVSSVKTVFEGARGAIEELLKLELPKEIKPWVDVADMYLHFREETINKEIEEVNNRYKQALEEIRKLIKGHKVADEVRLKSIITKIDEVLRWV